MPGAPARRAAARRARGAPRHAPARPARAARRRLRRRGADGLPRPPPARRVRLGDRRARPRARADLARRLLRLHGRARSSSCERQQQRYVTQQKEIARLEEAIRRFRHWAHIRVNERMITQARVKQMQIDKMEKVERPVLERRKMALAAAQRRRAAASACSRSRASTSRSATTRCCSTSTSSSMRGERVGVVGPNGAGKTVLVRVLAGELEPSAGTRWAGAGHRRRLPLPGGRRPGPVGDGDRHAARAAARCAEDDAVRRLMALPVRLRAGAAPGRDAQRRRADAAGVPAADARRARTASCSTSRPTTSTSTRSRCSRTRSSTTTAPSSRSPTTATSSTGSPTGSCTSPTASVRAYEGGWSANVRRRRLSFPARRVGSPPWHASERPPTTRPTSPSAPGRTRSSAPSREFKEDNLTDWAAALTYYAVLSVFPALIALLSIVGLVADPATITRVLTDTISAARPGLGGRDLQGPDREHHDEPEHGRPRR